MLDLASPATDVRTGGPAILVGGLRVERGGKTVLAGVDLEISPGIVTGLLGPSGCGKTTLMRAIVNASAQRSSGSSP